ncbi:MAG: hypothetical protein GXO76_11450 [Calditrichaeota bacterium]|nr:hypothetical protein [Calditrichota bacterium]
MVRQILGEKRTGVFTKELSIRGILEALKSGKCFITDGPAIHLRVKNNVQAIAEMGDTISGFTFEIHAKIVSTPEFGKPQTIRLLLGRISKMPDKIHETVLRYQTTATSEYDAVIFRKITLNEPKAYVRVEVKTHAGKTAYSNPVWLEKEKGQPTYLPGL